MSSFDVPCPPNTWVDIYASTGIIVGTQITAVNNGSNDVRLAATLAQPTGATAHAVSRSDSVKFSNNVGDPGAWALCIGGGSLYVYEGT